VAAVLDIYQCSQPGSPSCTATPRKGPLSVLLRVEVDEDTHETVKVDTITPVHRHGS
jgi:hypothetical protein